MVKKENIFKKIYGKIIDHPLHTLNWGTLIIGIFLALQITNEYVDMNNKERDIIVRNQNEAVKQSSGLTLKVLSIMEDPGEIITIDPRLKDMFNHMKEEGINVEMILPVPDGIPKELKITPEYVKHWIGTDSSLLDQEFLEAMIEREKNGKIGGYILEKSISDEKYNILVKKIESEFELIETVEDIAKIFAKSDKSNVESYSMISRSSNEYCKSCHGYEGNKSIFIHTSKNIEKEVNKEIEAISKFMQKNIWGMTGLGFVYLFFYGAMRRSVRKNVESEEKFKAMSESAHDAIIMANYKGVIIYWNPGAEKIFGYLAEEAVGNNLQELIIPERYTGAHSKGFKKFVETGSGLVVSKIHYNLSGRKKNGTEFLLDLSVSGVKLHDEWCALGIIRDITARKRLDELLSEGQRLKALEVMAKSVAHDFNNSLTSILGSADLGLVEEGISEEIYNILTSIKKSSFDAASRINTLQRFGGKKGGKGKYVLVNLNTVVEDAIAESRPLWKDKREKEGIVVSVEANYGELKPVLANDADLRSVMFNIIKNSIESMPEGGKIKINTHADLKNIHVNVQDTGTGMDSDTKMKIFEPFYTTKGFELGRGLGMSAAYSIIKEHNGEIYIKETVPKKGTTIEIKLPVAEEKKIKSLEKTLKNEVSANILWVEDEESIRDIVQKILKKIGHKGDVVGSGQEALECLKKKNYDMVITDIGMAGMSGWQLADKINEEYNGKVKIAVVTGWGDDISIEERKKHGVEFVLGKPITIKSIENLIGKIMRL